MERTNVTSSNIASIGYDLSQSVLEVEFISGDIYQYFNVPQHLYLNFMSASSKGSFLSDHIRFNYRYHRVG